MKIQGSLVAVVSPMKADGSLDFDAYRNLLDWHIESGTSAIIAVGTTGKSPTVNIKQGIFQCEIRLFNGLASYDTPPKATYTISLTKRNRQWQVIHQSPYKPFTNTL